MLEYGYSGSRESTLFQHFTRLVRYVNFTGDVGHIDVCMNELYLGRPWNL